MSTSHRSPSLPTQWSDESNTAVSRCIPPLTNESHKGSSGRIGVLGGSARYTGAPYYAAMASLKVGADLAFVFSSQEAAIPIKCYSPELMVASVYSATEFDKLVQNGQEDSAEAQQGVNHMVHQVQELFGRMHVLIVGPGMGRCPLVMRAAARLVAAAQKVNLPVLLDADALFMITQPSHQHLVAQTSTTPGQPSAPLLLTPNAMEYQRLLQALQPDEIPNDMDSPNLLLQHLRRGVVVIAKGHVDVISGTGHSMICQEEGGLKRSGGLGDVLAGTLGTLVVWNRLLGTGGDDPEEEENDILWACWTACCIVKRATRVAFQQKKRAMTAPDVLQVLGDTVEEMTTAT